MRIIIDNREQRPFAFAGSRYEGVITEPGSLSVGDYSLVGLTDLVAVERKSLPDLVACLGRERDRFMREMVRARGLERFAVVCECTWSEITGGQYRSQITPQAASQSILSIIVKYGHPIIFAGNREGAEYATHSFLRQYLHGAHKRLAAIEKAHHRALNTSQGMEFMAGRSCKQQEVTSCDL